MVWYGVKVCKSQSKKEKMNRVGRCRQGDIMWIRPSGKKWEEIVCCIHGSGDGIRQDRLGSNMGYVEGMRSR